MQQEIVFCESIFKTIKGYFENEEVWDAYTYKNNLSNIKIITSKANKKIIELYLNKGDVFNRGGGFYNIFKEHLFNSNKLIFDIPIKNGLFHQNTKINILFNLACKTEDKIIHSELKNIKSKLDENKFEILNINDLNKPPTLSRFISNYRNIGIKRGNRFDFTKVFKPYLRQTRQIKIYDKYIRKKTAGYSNLIKILSMCVSLKTCEIYTLTIENDSINKFDMSIEELEFELKHKYSFDIKIMASKKHRRVIITDEFEIKVDPGLDFVDKDYICQKNDVDIQINKINLQKV